MTVTRVLKSGHGYYVRIDKAFLDRMDLAPRSLVTVELDHRGILILPLRIAKEEEVPK